MDLKHQKLCFNVTDDEVYKVAMNYNVSKKMVDESLENIKEWYKLQPHLPKGAFEDRIILRFLMAAKFSLEITKQRIDNMLTARMMIPIVYAKRDPFDKKLLDTMKVVQNVALPMLTNERHRIVILRYTEANPENYNPNFAYGLSAMMHDLRLMFDVFYGDQIIIDLTNFKIGHVLNYDLTGMKRGAFLFQDCYSGIVKGIHIIKFPSYANSLYKVGKMFLSAKIFERFHFHDSYESLHAHIDPKYLPTNFNGSAMSIEETIDLFIKTLQSDDIAEWLKRSGSMTSDESKRIKEISGKSADLMGIAGSFRKLEVD